MSAPRIPATTTPRRSQGCAEGVHAHGPPEQEGLEHVRLELLHGDDATEHDQCLDGSEGDEREQDGDSAGDQGTDHRDERAEEHEDGDAGGERHPEDARDQPDAEGVDGRDEDRRAGERRQLPPRDDAGGVDALTGVAGEEAHHPRPDRFTLVEEEEEGEERDEEPAPRWVTVRPAWAAVWPTLESPEASCSRAVSIHWSTWVSLMPNVLRNHERISSMPWPTWSRMSPN